MKRILQKTKHVVSKNKILYSFLFLAIVAIPITGILVQEKQIITQYASNSHMYTLVLNTMTIDQKPFSGATVIVDPQGDNNPGGITAITRSDGTVTFPEIPEGIHNIIIMYQGLKRAQTTITLQGDNPNITINLLIAKQPRKEVSIPAFLFVSLILITVFVMFLLLWYHERVKRATAYTIPINAKPHPKI